MFKWPTVLFTLLLGGCGGFPKNVTPVENFDLNNYLGKWYEIARLDHSFERGLQRVSAEYSLLENNKVKVVNIGYNTEKDKWKEAVGKAYLAGGQGEGYLKVSFFGPFYSSYVIFALDKENYQYAFVSGPNHNYLWLLARTPEISKDTIQLFIDTAKKKGFKTDDLIFVEH